MADVEAAAHTAYPFVWRWHCRLPERHGQRCRIIAHGLWASRLRMNSVCVEFIDGHKVITSGWAVRKA